MLSVETVGRIRRLHFVEGGSIKKIVRLLKVSRNTVRRVLRAEQPRLSYERGVQPRPQLGPYATPVLTCVGEPTTAPEVVPARGPPG